MPKRCPILTKENLHDYVAGRESGCLEWLGVLSPEGYGRMGNHAYVHRVVYELWNGPIPEGKQIDHLCRNRKCVNPKHLEAVTQRENILRGNGMSARHIKQTHCVNGHEFNDANTWRNPKRSGNRQCRVCAKLRMRERKRRQRDARKASVS